MSDDYVGGELVRKFQRIYAGLTLRTLGQLNELYAPNIHFIDPFHAVRGREEFLRYMQQTYDGVAECSFTYDDVIEQEGRALVAWTMRMRHLKFRPDEVLTLRGASRLHFERTITFQEDYYDCGAMLYERIPLIGAVVRAVKRRAVK